MNLKLLAQQTAYVAEMSSAEGAVVVTNSSIPGLIHPMYRAEYDNWLLYRACAKGGSEFVSEYLRRYSAREDDKDFKERVKSSYCPAIAKNGVRTVKNVFSQRMNEVVRAGGPKSYQDAVRGDALGVDLFGSSMNCFIDSKILTELLAIRKVGVYVDAPVKGDSATLMDVKRPYLYVYRAEDIRTWTDDDGENDNQFKAVLLRECRPVIDEATGLTIGETYVFRFLKKTDDGKVTVQYYNLAGEMIDQPRVLELDVIPFVVGELNESLLTDIAQYQVALLNMNSADLDYSMKMNFPFYTEQFDPRGDDLDTKQTIRPLDSTSQDAVTLVEADNGSVSRTSAREAKVGVTAGRAYAKGLNAPAFIHPSSEPLRASMEKEEQMKREVRELLTLSLSNLTSTSLDLSVQDTRQGLESGLHNIGLTLEFIENRIAVIWAKYEVKDPANVKYPRTYSLKTDKERIDSAKEMQELRNTVPSKTYQKEVSKQISKTLLDGHVDQATMDKIYKEIDDAKTMTSDIDTIKQSLELGIVSEVTASDAVGFDGAKEVPIAREEHAKRIARIQAAQSPLGEGNPGARGVKDAAPNAGPDAKAEKQAANTTKDGLPTENHQRGNGV